MLSDEPVAPGLIPPKALHDEQMVRLMDTHKSITVIDVDAAAGVRCWEIALLMMNTGDICWLHAVKKLSSWIGWTGVPSLLT